MALIARNDLMMQRILLGVVIIAIVAGVAAWWRGQTTAATSSAITQPSKSDPSRYMPSAPASNGNSVKISAQRIVSAPYANMTVATTGNIAFADIQTDSAPRPRGIRFATGPENGLALARDRLKQMSGRPLPLTNVIVEPDALEIKSPYLLYELENMEQLAQDESLESALAYGYIYPVEFEGNVVAVMTARVDESGTTKIVSIGYGDWASAASKAFKSIAAMDAIQSNSYEARLIRSRFIDVLAVWLKADTGGADLVYSLAPLPDGLQAGKLYPMEEYMKAMHTLVQNYYANKEKQRLFELEHPRPPDARNWDLDPPRSP